MVACTGRTIVCANEFRKGDVIWDNARIACTPGTDSVRLERPETMEDPTLPCQCVAIGKRSSTNQVTREILANPRHVRTLVYLTRIYLACTKFRFEHATPWILRIPIPVSTRRNFVEEGCECYFREVVYRSRYFLERDKEKRFFGFSRAVHFLSILRQGWYEG